MFALRAPSLTCNLVIPSIFSANLSVVTVFHSFLRGTFCCKGRGRRRLCLMANKSRNMWGGKIQKEHFHSLEKKREYLSVNSKVTFNASFFKSLLAFSNRETGRVGIFNPVKENKYTKANWARLGKGPFVRCKCNFTPQSCEAIRPVMPFQVRSKLKPIIEQNGPHDYSSMPREEDKF